MPLFKQLCHDSRLCFWLVWWRAATRSPQAKSKVQEAVSTYAANTVSQATSSTATAFVRKPHSRHAANSRYAGALDCLKSSNAPQPAGSGGAAAGAGTADAVDTRQGSAPAASPRSDSAPSSAGDLQGAVNTGAATEAKAAPAWVRRGLADSAGASSQANGAAAFVPAAAPLNDTGAGAARPALTSQPAEHVAPAPTTEQAAPPTEPKVERPAEGAAVHAELKGAAHTEQPAPQSRKRAKRAKAEAARTADAERRAAQEAADKRSRAAADAAAATAAAEAEAAETARAVAAEAEAAETARAVAAEAEAAETARAAAEAEEAARKAARASSNAAAAAEAFDAGTQALARGTIPSQHVGNVFK